MDPRDVIITHMHGDTMINVLALILAILCCDDVRRCASTSPQRSHKDILNPCVHPSSYGEGFCVILNPCVHPSSYGEGFCNIAHMQMHQPGQACKGLARNKQMGMLASKL